MAIDYLGMLGQAGSAWYTGKKFDEAEENISGGFDDARKSLQEYEQPYADFGLRQMEEFEKQGQFKFGAEEFEASPGYQFRQEEGARAISRSQAAQKMLGSGNTLAALQERGQNIAKEEFQASYDRAQGAFKTNFEKNKFGVDVGAKVAMNIGDNLADLGIGEGMALAQLNGMQAEAMSKTIASTLTSAGNPTDPSTVSGWINEAIGAGVENVGGFIKDKLMGAAGGLVTKAAGALGFGGTAAAAEAATGFTGAAAHAGFGKAATDVAAKQIGSKGVSAITEKFGANALAQSSLVTSGFATWAGFAAAGLGGLFALKSIVGALRGESRFNKAAKKIGKSNDPLGYIAGMSGDKLPRSTRHSEDGWFKMKDNEARGSMYSMVLKNMTPQQGKALRGHKDFGKISNDLFKYLQSGAGGGGKHAKGSHPYKALSAMYPEVAENDWKAVMQIGANKFNRTQSEMTAEDPTSPYGGGMSWWQEKEETAGRAAMGRVRAAMRKANGVSTGMQAAGGLLAGWNKQGGGVRRKRRFGRRRIT